MKSKSEQLLTVAVIGIVLVMIFGVVAAGVIVGQRQNEGVTTPTEETEKDLEYSPTRGPEPPIQPPEVESCVLPASAILMQDDRPYLLADYGTYELWLGPSVSPTFEVVWADGIRETIQYIRPTEGAPSPLYFNYNTEAMLYLCGDLLYLDDLKPGN